MAIGIGHMLGFKYPQNFNQPYSATSVTDFWRRWHMSLSSWFRDYLYIPLGGNRTQAWRTYINLAAVFLLCGLWHGAAWTFIIWGAWHGFLLVLERVRLGMFICRLPRYVGQSYTLLVVMIGWVFFRAKDVPYALDFIRVLFGAGGIDSTMLNESAGFDRIGITALAAGIFLATRYRTSNGESHTGFALPAMIANKKYLAKSIELLLLAGIILLSTASLAAGTYNPFIYFRF
jgi:alginate O-acetyltransferase complex protein AlgI